MRLIFALLVLLISSPSLAQQQITFNKRQSELIGMAQDYLARVRTFSANFIQISPDSSMVSSGEIYLSKPGRLKMSYTEPYKIDYYINDDDILQYDHDLDEVTRGEAPENPLKVLLYNDTSLINNDIMDVSNVVEDGQVFFIFMLNRTDELREMSGMILKFRKMPVELIGIQRIDNEGNKIETNLTAVSLNKPIDDSEFTFKKPKKSYPSSK